MPLGLHNIAEARRIAQRIVVRSQGITRGREIDLRHGNELMDSAKLSKNTLFEISRDY
ncbi:hypothetical protein DPMN_168889 [Dreissena polymorpha]|uniref:Uncharacterized protein n=1 Tax=Dreissena polymorpha TaxID=45954 RepID=A0A9D4J022_DREPO|nr:hypothetical protein DPMN_168889 [Dreissena polymorpha]